MKSMQRPSCSSSSTSRPALTDMQLEMNTEITQIEEQPRKPRNLRKEKVRANENKRFRVGRCALRLKVLLLPISVYLCSSVVKSPRALISAQTLNRAGALRLRAARSDAPRAFDS